MKIALSTNWCCRRIERGEEIAALAEKMGFAALELGFHTTAAQAEEIVKCARLPVTSVHAFCPVPISAPQGYPELYTLACFDEEARAMARFQIKKNIAFAASVGASALVLHTGRVYRGGFVFLRRRRIRKMSEIFARELDLIRSELEKHSVTLGIENMPYAEGFPNITEVNEYCGDFVRPWYDTGHGFVLQEGLPATAPVGFHINDSNGGDDHLPPGEGKVDFKAIAETVKKSEHIVFEPNENVTEERLVKGLEFFKNEIKGEI